MHSKTPESFTSLYNRLAEAFVSGGKVLNPGGKVLNSGGKVLNPGEGSIKILTGKIFVSGGKVLNPHEKVLNPGGRKLNPFVGFLPWYSILSSLGHFPHSWNMNLELNFSFVIFGMTYFTLEVFVYIIPSKYDSDTLE